METPVPGIYPGCWTLLIPSGFLVAQLGDAQKRSNLGVGFYNRVSPQQVFQNFLRRMLFSKRVR